MIIKTPILPDQLLFTGQKGALDLKSICIFAATGFFFDDDTYFEDYKVLKPGREYLLEDVSGKILKEARYFNWHYNPRERSLREVVLEFSELFETIINEQVDEKTVILPLSGGLDSRTQAAALRHIGANVNAYSYSFAGGIDESRYGKLIASVCQFPFQQWEIPYGYLWDCIEDLSIINQSYSEFTHPRQMAFLNEYGRMGDIFSLGHWGDVLFDDMRVADDMPFQEQVTSLKKKVLKKGGLQLAESLWRAWSLDGNFEDYLTRRIEALLHEINIPESANAQIRAFKSLHWAPRWTSTNLTVFSSVRPISLPYYDNRMCEFICSVPERHLASRKVQIEYLKLRNPGLAKISWQEHRPFNLYNYQWDKMPWNLPYRVFQKLKYKLQSGNPVQRNWELQFMGTGNDVRLRDYLLETPQLHHWIPKELIADQYEHFKTRDAVYYSHPVSMLLTLSLFSKTQLVSNK